MARKFNRSKGSRCTCGHVGDKPESDHRDLFQSGHGPCRLCKCGRFRWRNWISDETQPPEAA